MEHDELEHENFKIHGKIISEETGKGIPNSIFTAIDKDLFFGEHEVTTDEKGNFEIPSNKKPDKKLEVRSTQDPIPPKKPKQIKRISEISLQIKIR